MVPVAHPEGFSGHSDDQPRPTPARVVTIAVGAPEREVRRRIELVNITVARADYEKLKALGGTSADYIEMALSLYVQERKSVPFRRDPASLGWRRGPVITFPCAIPKDLMDEVRSLPGRFDEHAIDALRLLFREDGIRPAATTQLHDSRLRSEVSRGFRFAAYSGAAFFATRILRLMNDFPLLNR